LSHSSPDSASSSIISLLELSHLSPDSASSSISSSPDNASSSINSSSINSSPDSASSSINSSPELSHSSPDSASSSINLPTSTLQLIASRCIGNAHVFLVPLEDTLDADIIALSDRPWLLHTAGRGISCTSLSFQSPNNVTLVCTMDYPKGILFYADNRLHLVRELHYSMMLPHCFIPLFLWSLFLL
jgi:splicing factor 3B subunit 3